MRQRPMWCGVAATSLAAAVWDPPFRPHEDHAAAAVHTLVLRGGAEDVGIDLDREHLLGDQRQRWGLDGRQREIHSIDEVRRRAVVRGPAETSRSVNPTSSSASARLSVPITTTVAPAITVPFRFRTTPVRVPVAAATAKSRLVRPNARPSKSTSAMPAGPSPALPWS